MLPVLPIILAVLALLGWALDIDSLKHGMISSVAMNPATAVCMILLAFEAIRLNTKNTHAVLYKAGQLAIIIVIAASMMKLGDLMFGWSFAIDQQLFSAKLDAELNHPSRMAPNTAACFLMLGLAMQFMRGRSGSFIFGAQMLAAVVSLLALLALIGHMFDIRALFGLAQYIPMAVNTALAFLLISASVLLPYLEKGFVRFFASAAQGADDGAISTTARFPLLRRFSITSLAAMFITAAILIFLYQQDQFAEHENIAAQENEKTVVHLSHLLDDQIATLISTTEGLDTQALRANPNIGLFTAALESVREHHIVKLKIFNSFGIVVYSSVTEEIGTTSRHPDWLAKALRGEVVHQLEFRNTILAPSGELHDRYIANTYMPLTHAEKRIGVIEIYADATPIIQRIYSKTISIALVVL
jgi:hypothetical protein